MLRAFLLSYEAVFGPLPDLALLPKDAGPLDTPEQRTAWRTMSEDARREVPRVFATSRRRRRLVIWWRSWVR